MKPLDLNKYKFKMRSLPNSKTFSTYFDNYMYFFVFYAIFNFIYICIIAHDFVPIMPAPFVFGIPIVFFHTYNSIERNYLYVSKDTLKDVIIHIRLKHSQSLLESLEDNPELLTSKYNKKSLLYWAKHYNNVEANSIIIEQLKKPRSKVS